MAIACPSTEALLIVLHIPHHQTMQLPQEISIDVLREVAILVDSYELHKAVGTFLGHWTIKLIHTIPNGAAPELISWSWTSRVSSSQLLHRATAELALRMSPGSLLTQKFRNSRRSRK